MATVSQTFGTALPADGTLASVVARLELDPRIDARQRAQFGGAIRTVCSIVGRAPDAVPADLADIDRLLREVPRAVHGRSAKTLANVRSRVKGGLLHCSNAASPPPRGTPLTSAWTVLAERLPTLAMRNGLSRLIRSASFRGLAPDEVDDAFLQQVVAEVSRVNWGRSTLPFWRTTASLWNEAVTLVEGWPQQRLTEPPPGGRHQHLSIDAFPASFRTELDRYLAWTEGGDVLAEDAPTTPLKPNTLRLRRNQIRIAASILAGVINGAESIINIAMLVEPANAKKTLTWMLDQAPDHRPTAFIRGIAATLVAVARHWVKVPPSDLDELRRVRRKLGGEPTGLTEKNRKVLRQLEDERTLAALLGLPEALLHDAKSLRMTPGRRLQKVQIALAIRLLQIAPLRLANLAAVRLDQHLQWPAGRSGTVYLSFVDVEVKNEQPLDYPIDGGTKDLLHEYLDRYRPIALPRTSSWLFVRKGGERMTGAALRDGITKAIKRALGIHVTPHMFRHICAQMYLDAHPGALGDVKDLLGHKNLKTTQNFYAGRRTRQVALEFDRIVDRARNKKKEVS